MTTNLLENITEQLTPKMIQHVGTLMGETPAHAQKAVDGAILSLLAGLMYLSSSGDGPTRLVNLINHRNYGRLLNNLSGLLNEGNTAQTLIASGQDILSTLFTDKLSAVSALIANASGVTSASASSLLSLTAPVVVGVLGRVRAAQGLNAVGLTALLIARKDDVSRQAPAGLAGVFGLNNVAEFGARLADTATRMASEEVERARKGSSVKKWLWPAFAVFAFGLAYLLLGRGTEGTQVATVTRGPAAALAGVPITLPDGTALFLKEGSFNYDVAKFLGDATTTTVPKTFVFDRLNFDVGTPHLTAESMQTVDDLRAILRAYPSAAVRVDGYTDGLGNAEDSKKSSLERAEAVKEALIKGGISATRVTPVGYGQENPLASNETQEGRAKNWRLELVVKK